MQFTMSRRAGPLLVAAAIAGGITSGQVAFAQQQSTGTATVTGEVDRCTNNQTVPLADAQVTADGSGFTARSDTRGEFTLSGLKAPGVYTITVNGGSAGIGSRPGIPVQPNQVLDIGQVLIGSVFGCGDDTQPAAPAPTATPVPPTSTPLPTSTPVPVETPATTDIVVPAEPATIDVPPANTDVGPQPADTSPDEGVTGLPGPDEPTP